MPATASKKRQDCLVPHHFFPKTGTPFRQSCLEPPGKMAASFDPFFVSRPLELNETRKQMETDQITKAAAG
jgi:hypothetical protein